MSRLLVKPRVQPDRDGTVLIVTPASAGWSHVGFEVLRLAEGQLAQRATAGRELCVVVIAGSVDLACEHGDWPGLGGRADPFSGMPDAAYLPPPAPRRACSRATRCRWRCAATARSSGASSRS
jgi:5-deoxy-glucuronate isomerase